MDPEDVLEIVRVLRTVGVGYWLDGSWGLDALVGEQTRSHRDVDILVDRADLDVARLVLEKIGFEVTMDESPHHLVMRDGDREIDMPTAVRTAEGIDVDIPDGSTLSLRSEHLSKGRILGVEVPALSGDVHAMTDFRYPPHDTDLHDMDTLFGRLGVHRPSLDRRLEP